MQIAIRDDQPRFDSAGGARATKPASGNPFDELVRAMSARDSRSGPERVADDLPGRDEPRDPAAGDYPADYAANDYSAKDYSGRDYARPDADPQPQAERLADEHAHTHGEIPTADPAQPAATEAAPATTGDAAATGETATGETAAADPVQQPAPTETATATPAATSGEAAATQPVAQVNGQRATAQIPAAGATSAGTVAAQQAALGLDDGMLAQLQAALQTRSPLIDASAAMTKAAPAAAGKEVPGLPIALLAQSLVTATQAPNGQAAPTQPGQRAANGQGVAKAQGKQALGPQGKGEANAAAGPAVDFRSVAAALANSTARGAAAPTSATAATSAVDGAAATTSTSTSTPVPGATPGSERAAQATRAEAPPPAHHTPRLSGPQFAERVGLTIVRAAETGADRVSIRLNPAELGRIDVKMELGQDGRMTLTVAADRPETLDQLQKNVRDLERSLNDAGFSAGAGDLSFSLRQQQSSNDHESGGRSGGRDGGEAGTEPGVEEADDGIVITHRSGSHLVVDLFV
jgi:flagellar hook-length control protein FliK